MNKDNRNIYNGYILREAGDSPDLVAAKSLVKTYNNQLDNWPSNARSGPGYDQVVTALARTQAKITDHEAKMRTQPSGDTGDAGTKPSGSKPSVSAAGTVPPPEKSLDDYESEDQAATPPLAAPAATAKPMPQNWRNASWSRNSRRMSGNLASNARLKKAAQGEWDKRESRRLEKGETVAPAQKYSRTSNAIAGATPPPPVPPPAKPAAKQPAKNTLGGWLKSLAPGGARPGDNIPGRVKQRKVDPNRPAFTGADSWKQQKATKRLDRKTRRATKRANRQSSREARRDR